MDCTKTGKVLNDIYKMKQILIPTFKESQFTNLGSMIIDQKEKYNNEIIKKIIKYSQTRACLVIFEYIQQANDMYNILKNQIHLKNNIIIYSKEEQSDFLSKELNIGDIILSTNLSGRGTDIIISPSLQINGGLHVILTFFPESKRVEMQALGRAGRKGEKGSGEILVYSFEKSIVNLENQREKRENDNYNDLINNFMNKNSLYQNLFEQFCNEIKELKTANSVEDNLINDIKERWGLFLIDNINTMENKEIIIRKFKQLIEEIKNNLSFNNPFILSRKRNFESLKQSINLSDLSLGSMYYIIPHQIVKNNISVSETKNYFENLNKIIELLIRQLNKCEEIIIDISKKERNNSINDLFNQNLQKKLVFKTICENIKSNMIYLSAIEKDEKKYILIYDKNMTKRLSDEIGDYYPDDIINYFYDYGINFLLIFITIKKNEIILKMVLMKEIIKVVVLGCRFKCFLLLSNIINNFY
jgi:hypothetical protein